MSVWSNPDAVAELRSLVATDLSFDQIARELSPKYGAVSRNACIGKASRLGIGRPEPTFGTRIADRIRDRLKAARKPKGPKNPRRQKHHGFSFAAPKGERVIPTDEDKDLPPDQSPFAVTLEHLGGEQCRWPLAEPAHDMLYCGAITEPDAPYCTRHCCIAYARRRA